ncbi:hypothetical protein [Hymenobacter sp. YC55]|uniref:hypothetical protein n=1 Tax=Hymenobacter sp. YC55 TaxID=3034019 RepID=UPI0023F92308|nr:hypothetical protein [Hymenobacter sp. YC55]MDF7810756.1 hypothetical protein [Hymenobacter sp. YC55]
MAFTYTPFKHTGKHASEIFSEVVEEAATTAQNLITFYDNVKDEINLTTFSGEPEFDAYQEKIREADLDNYATELEASDYTMVPKKMQSIILFEMDKLRGTRFGESMKAGANNIQSTTFESAARTHLTPRYALAFEKKIWCSITPATKTLIANSNTATVSQKAWAAAQTTSAKNVVDGLIAKAILAGIKPLSATTITSTNLKDQYEKLFVELPSAVLGKKECLVYAPHSHKLMIDIFNTNQTYRDIFKVSGDVYTFHGKRIAFVSLPENSLVSGLGPEFGAATDLLSDSVSFEIGKVNNVGDQMFSKLTCSLDTGIVVPSQKVLYI